jgi:hypothetical protein
MQPSPRRREHPFLAKNLEAMPAGLKELARQTLKPDELAQTIFVIPEQMMPKKFGGLGGAHLVPDQALLFTSSGIIHVQVGKSTVEMEQSQYMPGNSLLYLRISLVLLYGQIELYGVANNSLTCINVQYNAVSHELVLPALKKFLRLAWDQTRDQELDTYQNLLLGQLEDQSYKFRSGLELYSLQPDEHLLGFVFQPRIFKQYLRVFRRLIAPASLLAVTDRQLIMINEGITSASSYGYFFTFCPKANVVQVDSRANNSLQEVGIHLEKNSITAEHQLTQDNENALACQALWATHGW